MIGILNYGSGNIKAFSNIYKSFGISIRIIEDKNDLEGVSKIILPGVGSFDRVLEKLRSAAFFNLLEDLVLNKEIPILGICVGMQIMAQRSDEGVCKGLGWIGGEVHHLSKLKTNMQIPHMGWNQIHFSEKNELFSGIKNFDNFYFFKQNKTLLFDETFN
jgi:glutamine amidotransferase